MQWFADLKFYQKILSLTLLAATAFLIVLTSIISGGRKNEVLLQEIETGHFPALMLRRDLEEGLAALQRGLQDAAASLDEDILAETDALNGRLLEQIRQARGNPTLDEEELGALEASFSEYYELAADTTRKLISGESGQALTTALQEMTASYGVIQGLLQENTEKQSAAMEEAFQGARKNQVRSVKTSTVVILLCLGFLVLLSLGIARSLTRALGQAVHVSGKIANGDLTVSLDGGERFSRDEVGSLLESLKSMTENLRGMIFKVQASSDEVFGASEEISSSYGQISSGANNQFALSQESSSVIEEMAASMRTVAESAESMAGRAETTSSTITELGSSIQSVAENAVELSSAVDQTSTAIEEMSASISEIARTSRIQHSSSKEAEEGMERIVQTIRNVAEHVDQAKKIAGSSRRKGEEGAEAARRAIESMQKMAEVAGLNAEAIREVSRQSSDIENIINVIEDISDQTNLLALNAAIIAAQAGEHGRGFAVVADEVRELANRSMSSVKDISKVIKEILTKTHQAVSMAENTIKEAEKSRDLAGTTGEAFESIMSGVNETAGIVDRISEAGLEQQDISSQAMSTMKNLGEISSQVNRSTTELETATNQIKRAAENMSAVNQRVTSATGEQATQSRLVVQEVQEMNSLIQQVFKATEEQGKGSEAMTSAILRISEVARQNLEATRKMASNTEKLAKQAEDLKTVAEAFRT